MKALDWTKAACTTASADLFFPESKTPKASDAARATCLGCSQLVACREWALGFPEMPGVYGAMSMHERRMERRRRKAAAAAALGEQTTRDEAA